eukprot:COSAG02_NODE_15565_length_1159_cov_11.709857_1_plen_67_part_10
MRQSCVRPLSASREQGNAVGPVGGAQRRSERWAEQPWLGSGRDGYAVSVVWREGCAGRSWLVLLMLV